MTSGQFITSDQSFSLTSRLLPSKDLLLEQLSADYDSSPLELAKPQQRHKIAIREVTSSDSIYTKSQLVKVYVKAIALQCSDTILHTTHLYTQHNTYTHTQHNTQHNTHTTYNTHTTHTQHTHNTTYNTTHTTHNTTYNTTHNTTHNTAHTHNTCTHAQLGTTSR